MRTKHLMTVLLLAAVAIPTQAAVMLNYSGADWSADPTSNSTMTITATEDGNTLWEMDILTNGGASAYTSITRFADGGTFNYASGAGNYRGVGLMKVGYNGYENRGQLHQISKTDDQYIFSLTYDTVATNWKSVVTYTISKPDVNGTNINAQYELTRITDPGDEAWQAMGFRGALNIGSNDTGTVDYVSGYELAAGQPDVHVGRMHQRIADAAPGLYSVTENMDSTTGPVDTAASATWAMTVADNSETAALGMTPGLQFAYSSDLYPYYAGSLGSFGVTDSAAYYDGLGFRYYPRQWQGQSPSPYPIMQPGETYTSNFNLDINITAIPEPASLSLIALAGLAAFRLRR